MTEQMSETDDVQDEKPDMSSDMADFDSVSQEIASQELVESESQTDTSDWDLGDGEGFEIDGQSVTIGDIYCNLITVLANETAKRKGSGEALFEDDNGELDTTLAKQLQIDEYVNQIAAKHSAGNMGPEQALAFSTIVFIGAVMVSDPKIMKGINLKRPGGNA